MKNSSELTAYARSFHPSWKLDDGYFASFVNQLNEEEDVSFSLACMGIEDGSGNFLYGNGAGVLVSSRRILMGGTVAESGSVVGFTEIPLQDVRKIDYARKNMIYGVELFLETVDEHVYAMVLLDSRKAKQMSSLMNAAVREGMKQVQNAERTESPLSMADEIRKLKALKDEGILSEAEFEAGKKKLLGLQ